MRRNKVRFGLVALFAAIAIASVPLAMLRYGLQRRAARESQIFSLHGRGTAGMSGTAEKHPIYGWFREGGRLEAICTFSAYNSDLTDEDLQLLAGLENLRLVALNDTKVTDDGLPVLATLPNLRWLRITSSLITDEGLMHLAKCPKLESLFIESDSITDEGAARFRQMRPDLAFKPVRPLPYPPPKRPLSHGNWRRPADAAENRAIILDSITYEPLNP
ncbi:MAG: hypothetical protein KY475_27285 [Planctomycetes bacterium]|nr:hypothetical protein [Planctomycetota bacterium]